MCCDGVADVGANAMEPFLLKGFTIQQQLPTVDEVEHFHTRARDQQSQRS